MEQNPNGRRSVAYFSMELGIDKHGVSHPELYRWIDFFIRDKHAAVYEFWCEMHKGTHEMLWEYPA